MSRFTRRTVLCLVVSLLCFALTANAAVGDKLTVRVMTRNMDAGTDLNFFLGATTQDQFATAAFQTYQEVLAARIPERAVQLAAEIAEAKPDLVALQEATIWRTGPFSATPANTASTILYDQIALLMSALKDAGASYRVVVEQSLSDVEVPIVPANLNLRFTDRDAILIRTDVPPGHLDAIGTETRLYEQLLPFPTPGGSIPILRGWESADVKIRGARFKFVNTHLETAFADIVETVQIQAAQAAQLVSDLSATSLPIILGGDFNSNAAPVGPDRFEANGIITGGGFADAWATLYPAVPGFTWPLFFEDQLAGSPVQPFERIDVIYYRGPELLSIVQTGTEPNSEGVYASDHVGVMAGFELSNHRPDVPQGRIR